MDIKELRQKTDKELTELVANLREQLRIFRFEVAADSMKDVRDIREAKKTVARALTLLARRAKDAKSAPVIAK